MGETFGGTINNIKQKKKQKNSEMKIVNESDKKNDHNEGKFMDDHFF